MMLCSLKTLRAAGVAWCLTGLAGAAPAVALSPAELRGGPGDGQTGASAPAELAGPEARLVGDERLQRLYEPHGFLPIWLDAAAGGSGAATGPVGLSAGGRAVLEALEGAREEGLDPSRYLTDRIAAARRSGDWQALDVLLSAGLLDYVTDMTRGREETRSLGSELDKGDGAIDPVLRARGIASAADPVAALAALAPSHPQYARLRRTLAELREISATGGWRRIPDGETLDPGMRDPRVVDLRERLAASGHLAPQAAGQPAVPPLEAERSGELAAAPGEAAAAAAGAAAGAGDAESAADASLFGSDLEAAVRAFQTQHGLQVDGRVGPETLGALNRSVDDLVRQVQANMERWRWLPQQLGPRYILVNTAGHDLVAVKDGRPVLEMRVVNGRTSRETPSFSDEMEYLEVNPTWTVPPTIFAQDYLPKLRQNPGYLYEKNITLYASWSRNAAPVDPYAVDWHAVRANGRSLPYRLVQAPGPHNALGQIKFMLPNRFAIYLHDTPEKHLFARSDRAQSSGCVRVADPNALAALVLEDAPGWDMERLRRAYASGRTQRIGLERHWPVHIAYLTTWVDDAGTAHFYKDVYDRDAELIERIEGDLLLLAEEPEVEAVKS